MTQFKLALAASFAAALFSFPLAAQDKKTVGTVLTLEVGDVACYMTLRDDAGQRFQEMADFQICEQRTLLNKRVNLTYRSASVMADECQGNPDCKKSRQVMLVSGTRLAAAEAPKPSAPPPVQPTPVQPITPVVSKIAGTHCLVGEIVVFSCATGAKVVSACAGGGAQGHLQYRFGKLGDAPEISVPESPMPPARAATGTNVAFAAGGGVWMRFPRGANAYVVYSGIGNWGPRGVKKEIAGVVVEQNGKRTANVACIAKPQSELGPDLLQRLGVRSAGQDFDFPTED